MGRCADLSCSRHIVGWQGRRRGRNGMIVAVGTFAAASIVLGCNRAADAQKRLTAPANAFGFRLDLFEQLCDSYNQHWAATPIQSTINPPAIVCSLSIVSTQHRHNSYVSYRQASDPPGAHTWFIPPGSFRDDHLTGRARPFARAAGVHLADFGAWACAGGRARAQIIRCV
jgi:hypothetical protein